MIDLHCHSSYSTDCNDAPDAMIRAAERAGLSQIAITDHADFHPADPCVELTPYLAGLEKLKDQSSRTRLLIGIEIGIQLAHKELIREYLKGFVGDLVIGSMHRATELDLADGSFFKGLDSEGCWKIFLEQSIQAVEACPDFDILGHLDIIRRYDIAHGTNCPESCLELTDKLLRLLISLEKTLELNTSGYRYGLDSFHPSGQILARYFELGGRLVTLGSDAHATTHIAAHFDRAVKLLSQIGFREISVFENRRRSSVKLTSLKNTHSQIIDRC